MHAYIQDVPVGEELYAKIRANLGTGPIPGLLLHLVVRRDGGLLRYIDVWESEQPYRAFMDGTVEPIVSEVLAGYGIPHDHSLVTFEEVDVIDVWLGTGRAA